ncbi:tetratricopeptide repeat protein [Gracilimonas sp.]|uniref:tetratricopeptide repeat protein n=1 Tax=Gracilimonas sp. TaxID=1974203 RepID=UPI002870FC66|nr:hypothetical protein [Gracilimonas sp.]
MEERIDLTKNNFPYNKFVSATRGGEYTQDWRQSLTGYEDKSASILIKSYYRDGYTPNITNKKKQWFLYVEESQTRETEDVLKIQDLTYSRTSLWNGYLYQIETDKNQFFAPNFQEDIYYDRQFIDQLVSDRANDFSQYYSQVLLEFEEWRDTRLEDAVKAWRQNPNNYTVQENLIELSVEFSQITRAITILENRLLENPNWKEEDIERLLTFYGWEGKAPDAELFLERLWEEYQNEAVINLKNRAVAELGLFGENFENRLALRRLQLDPLNYEPLLEYTKAIESQENWPLVKENLLQLLEIKPQSDSLYAFTLQRSFFYEPADSTTALVESFPNSAYDQLEPFASNLALMYGYDIGDLEQALFWAESAPNFDERTKLFWISELDLHPLYLTKALHILNNNPEDDSLRSYIGTNLFYNEYQSEAYETMYPLFKTNDEKGLAADTLVRNEIGYMTYTQKKDFYIKYPLFFDVDQEDDLLSLYRRTEGTRISVNGEYKDDNFDNTLIRGGTSIQFGNRQDQTHTFNVKNLRFSDQNQQVTTTLDYYGVGYEYATKWNEQRMEFRTGGSFLAAQDDFVPEILAAFSFSKDSAFTSMELTGGPELTSTSVLNDYYQAQLQVYRQDFWLNTHISTGLSANSKYYTNNVLRYGATLRVFLESMKSKFRLKPGVDVGYSDATKNFPGGNPYYTPDQYFAQGAGFIFEYTDTNNSDYETRLSGEVFGKHERREGYFLSARAQLEHTFDNFWSVSVGSEISTSSVYRSNRYFFTISYYFPKDLLNN